MSRLAVTALCVVGVFLASCAANETMNCTYPVSQFFAHVEVYIDSAGPGMRSIWNASSFWAHDGKALQERMETGASVRALSSGSEFLRYNTGRVTTGDSTYDIDSSGKCKKSVAPPASDFSSACTGSVARFLATLPGPDEDDDFKRPAGLDDSYLGKSVVDGVPCAVYGWDMDSSITHSHEKQHRVFVSLDTGLPLLETHDVRLSMGYPAHAEARFSGFENIGDSFDYMENPGHIFAEPEPCNTPIWA